MAIEWYAALEILLYENSSFSSTILNITKEDEENRFGQNFQGEAFCGLSDCFCDPTHRRAQATVTQTSSSYV